MNVDRKALQLYILYHAIRIFTTALDGSASERLASFQLDPIFTGSLQFGRYFRACQWCQYGVLEFYKHSKRLVRWDSQVLGCRRSPLFSGYMFLLVVALVFAYVLLCCFTNTSHECSTCLTSYWKSYVCSIGLDDHLGKAFLFMNNGALCEFSYVC